VTLPYVAVEEEDFGEVFLGETVQFPVWVALDAFGVPMDLTGGTVKFTAKEDLSQLDTDPATIRLSTSLGGVVIVAPLLGQYQVTVPSSATASLTEGKTYQCDVEVVRVDGYTRVVKRGSITFLLHPTRS
jgi:hypothetical protein